MEDLALIRIFFYCVVFLVLGALHMIGSMAAEILLKKKVFKECMEHFLINVVFPEFKSPQVCFSQLSLKTCF